MQEEPIKLPGFGLPLTSYPSGEFDHHNDGRRARFPHAIADKCQSYGIMLGERRMMEFINQITDKKDWDKKVFDEEIVTKWRDEADVLDETKMEGEETVLIKGKVRSTKGRLDDSYLLPERFDYCIKELRDKADFYTKTGMILVWDSELAVIKSDTVVPDALMNSLRSLIHPLEDVPEHAKDWHPGWYDVVLDLLSPSFFPLISATSRGLRTETVPLDNCASYIGAGDSIDVLKGPVEHKCNGYEEYPIENAWGSFQWLPSDVCFTESGEPKINSYINNLHPTAHRELHRTLEKFVGYAIPLWNECLSWFEVRLRLDGEGDLGDEDFVSPDGVLFQPTESEVQSICSINSGDEDEDERACEELNDPLRPLTARQVLRRGGTLLTDRFYDWRDSNKFLKHIDVNKFRPRADWKSQTEHRPVDLRTDFRDSGLQVIFKLVNIHLTPENPEYEGGTWHIDGALNEHICATALFYYDDENITESSLDFRQPLDSDRLHLAHEQSEFESLERYYGVKNDGEAIQPLGSVLTLQGRLLAFPNVLYHRSQPFSLVDHSKPGHRKILAMFLVDPYIRVLSTGNVPPQRRDWWAEEVRKIHPFSSLPVEIFEMIIDWVDGFPLSWERALEIKEELLDERSGLAAELEDAMESNRFDFSER